MNKNTNKKSIVGNISISSLSIGTKHDYKHDRLWIRLPLEKMKYLLFSYHRSVVEAKQDIESHHSTRNACRIRWKMENGVS